MSTAAMRRSLVMVGVTALAGLGLSATSLAAQVALDDEDAGEHSGAVHSGPELRAAALRAVSGGEDTGEAARQLDRLASIADVDERARAETLQLAARLYWHANDLQAAHRTLSRAGLIANRAGASTLAVNLLLDAADVALAVGNQRAAWIAAQRAGKVIHRSDLSRDERSRLLARVVYADQPASLRTMEPLVKQ